MSDKPIRSVRVFAGLVSSASPEFAGQFAPATLTLIEHDRGHTCRFVFFVGVPIALTVEAPPDAENALRGIASDPRGWDTHFTAELDGDRVMGTFEQPHDHGSFALQQV